MNLCTKPSPSIGLHQNPSPLVAKSEGLGIVPSPMGLRLGICSSPIDPHSRTLGLGFHTVPITRLGFLAYLREIVRNGFF